MESFPPLSTFSLSGTVHTNWFLKSRQDRFLNFNYVKAAVWAVHMDFSASAINMLYQCLHLVPFIITKFLHHDHICVD